MSSSIKKRVAVVVLGDIGRSPRMQFHAVSLADHGHNVDLIGYLDSAPMQRLTESRNIRIKSLGKPFSELPNRNLVALLIRSIHRSFFEQFFLNWVIIRSCLTAKTVLIQNPPSIPAVFSLGIAKMMGTRIVVDWHNFGSDILALRFGSSHLLVRVYRRLERIIGRLSPTSICVSKAMAAELTNRFGIRNATVVYDLPQEQVLKSSIEDIRPPRVLLNSETCDPPLDDAVLNQLSNHHQRSPKVVVCPTSWTHDDDFDVLLDAIQRFDATVTLHTEPNECRLLVVITGEGQRRQEYIKRIDSMNLRHARVTTAWLSYENYLGLLRASDLGLCLHRSASGFDLPMKLADMKSCRILPCVLDYGPCLREQLTPYVDGLLFTDGESLATIFAELASSGETTTNRFVEIGTTISSQPVKTWQHQWDEVVLPVLEGLPQSSEVETSETNTPNSD